MLVLLETPCCLPVFPSETVFCTNFKGLLTAAVCIGILTLFDACSILCWCALIWVLLLYTLKLQFGKEITLKSFPLRFFSVFLQIEQMIAVNNSILVMSRTSLTFLLVYRRKNRSSSPPCSATLNNQSVHLSPSSSSILMLLLRSSV